MSFWNLNQIQKQIFEKLDLLLCLLGIVILHYELRFYLIHANPHVGKMLAISYMSYCGFWLFLFTCNILIILLPKTAAVFSYFLFYLPLNSQKDISFPLKLWTQTRYVGISHVSALISSLIGDWLLFFDPKNKPICLFSQNHFIYSPIKFNWF